MTDLATKDAQRNGARALVAVALVLGLALALRARPLLGALYVNLGAAHQAQTELVLYDADRAADPTLDEVRRQVDLSVTEARYNQVLDLYSGRARPVRAVAQARMQLAQIALSRGAYPQALEYAQAAWQGGARDWSTRLTLGDALVAEGEVAEGVEIVRGLSRAEARFECWAYYRHWVNGEYRQSADASRAIVLLNPENKRAADSVKQAEQKAKTQ